MRRGARKIPPRSFVAHMAKAHVLVDLDLGVALRIFRTLGARYENTKAYIERTFVPTPCHRKELNAVLSYQIVSVLLFVLDVCIDFPTHLGRRWYRSASKSCCSI